SQRGGGHERRLEIALQMSRLDRNRGRRQIGQGGNDQMSACRPASIDRRLVDASTFGNLVDAQSCVSLVPQHFKRGAQDRRDDASTASAGTRATNEGAFWLLGNHGRAGVQRRRQPLHSSAINATRSCVCVTPRWSSR